MNFTITDSSLKVMMERNNKENTFVGYNCDDDDNKYNNNINNNNK